MERSSKAVVATAAVAMLLAQQPAAAHHVMGGEMPATFWQGLLSGLGHPIIGIDHLAFVVGLGLMSAVAGHVFLLPCLFIAGTVVGCAGYISGVGIPYAELAIALTLCAAAVMVAMRPQVPTALLAAFFAGAGVVHGYAYGESIIGAEPAPLAAYIAGFAAVQYGIAVGAAAALRFIVGRHYAAELTASRAAAGAIALVAAVSLAYSVVGV
jgi:urease accessory protein